MSTFGRWQDPGLLAWKRLPRDMFSFEATLLLFLFAGRFKAEAGLADLPVDLTAVAFGLSVVVGGLHLYRRNLAVPRRGSSIVAATLLLVADLALSLAWTPGVVYARQKVLYAATLMTWPLVAGAFIVAPERERVGRLARLVVFASLLVAFSTLAVAAREGMDRVIWVVGSEYLGIGRAVGLAVAVAYVVVLTASSRRETWLGLALMLVLITVLLISGGRGPLLATLVVVVAPLALLPLVRRSAPERTIVRRAALTVLCLTLAFSLLLASGRAPVTLQRATLLVQEEGGGYSAAERAHYYGWAIESWHRHPIIGSGVGSFPILYDRPDAPFYPHNIFLELLAEQGVLGLALFLLVLLAAARQVRYRDLARDPLLLLVVLFALNTFVNAQVTADLPSNRMLFATLGLLALSPREETHA